LPEKVLSSELVKALNNKHCKIESIERSTVVVSGKEVSIGFRVFGWLQPAESWFQWLKGGKK